jgi:hypothetical protein
VFFVLFFSLLTTIYYYSGFYKIIVTAKHVYHVINKSNLPANAKVLLIGDSVADQLYQSSDSTQDINSLACSYAISTIGSYILLENYIEKNPDVRACVYVMTPFSFDNDLDLPYTYNYFLKPFYNKDNKKFFDTLVEQHIYKIPFYTIAQTPFALVSNWSPELEPRNETGEFLTDISITYLRKIKEACSRQNIGFYIFSPPISSYNYQKLLSMKRNIPPDLESHFSHYFDDIQILGDSLFYDHVHLKHPDQYASEFRRKIDRLTSGQPEAKN